jgi:hypothetical protein
MEDKEKQNSETHKIVSLTLLWFVLLLLAFAGIVKIVWSYGLFYVPKGYYAVIEKRGALISTEKRIFWFNPLNSRIHKYPKVYHVSGTFRTTKNGSKVAVDYELLFTLPTSSAQRCEVFRKFTRWESLKDFLIFTGKTKIRQIVINLPAEALNEICNGYYFPVHNQDIDKYGIKCEIKIYRPLSFK